MLCSVLMGGWNGAERKAIALLVYPLLAQQLPGLKRFPSAGREKFERSVSRSSPGLQGHIASERERGQLSQARGGEHGHALASGLPFP